MIVLSYLNIYSQSRRSKFRKHHNTLIVLFEKLVTHIVSRNIRSDNPVTKTTLSIQDTGLRQTANTVTQTTLGIQDTGRRKTANSVTQTTLGIQDTGQRQTATPVTQTTLGIQDTGGR
jgi:hypothetical protein